MDEPLATPQTPDAPPGRWGWRLVLRASAFAVPAALVALLVWGTLLRGSGSGLVNAIASGKGPAAPAFDLEVLWRRTDTWPRPLTAALIDGRLATAELRGRPTVLNFWASWCIPCRQEAPILTASARAHAGRVVFVGIDVQDLTGDAKAFLREFDVPYVSVRDGSERTYRVYGLTGVPETYYLDTAGRIIAHTPGAITRASLEAGISQATSGRPTP